MPDDILVRILSRLSVKDAVVTDSLSKRWRHLWRNLIRLNFDGTESLNKMANGEMISDLESDKFIKQVNNVISSHNHPMVQVFRIHFNLDCSYSECISEWIKFAIDKKVARLELDLLGKSHCARDPAKYYNFKLPSLNVVSLTLKMLVLCSVNLNEPSLNVILKNSPHLITLTMLNSVLFPHIRVGGRDINLKKIKLVACFGIESISLYDFDLKSFLYHGEEIELHLTDLPKLKKVDIGQVSVGSENNVFRQISSCAPNLEILILEVWFPQKSLDVNALLKFPNVKYLKLELGAEEDNCLLEFMAIVQACSRLETFSISLLWSSPLKRKRKVRRVVASEGHKHLKVVEIIGYCGRISDLELVVYAIDNAVALEEIVIDPCRDPLREITDDILKRQKAARTAATRQLTPLLPPGVDLAIR